MVLLTVVLPPIVLTAGLLFCAMLGVTPAALASGLFGLYVIVSGLWLTHRAAAGFGSRLEERDPEDLPDEIPPFPWRDIISCMALPAYVAALCLATGAFQDLRMSQPLATVGWSFATSATLALVGAAAALVTIQAIWRKTGSAGWFARFAAQLAGAATIFIALISAPFKLDVSPRLQALSAWWQPDYPFSWYGMAVDPRHVWLSVMIVLIAFGIASIAAIWRTDPERPGPPWMMPLFLLSMLGLLSGCSSITGPYLSHWIIGGFLLARLATYVIFIYEPKRGIDLRSGWLIAYLATSVLGIVALWHQLATGQFGMMMHPFLNELTMPVGMSSRPWSYYVAFWLFLTRDLLVLLLLNLRDQSRWSDLLGIGSLASILLLAAAARATGFDFLMPVLVPGYVLEPIDLLWPVATILGLLLLLWRAWHARLQLVE